MKNWKPLFIENSKIPVWLSKVAPIKMTKNYLQNRTRFAWIHYTSS